MACNNESDLATVTTDCSLSEYQKYRILTIIPSKLKDYPVNKQKRRYQPYWTDQFPWIRYSVTSNISVYCAPCFIFSKSHFNSEFVTSPFCDWKNATGSSRGALNRHSLSQTHQHCLEQAVNFIAVVEKKKQSIKSRLNEAYDKKVESNKAALLSIVDSIQFLSKQGLGFRGSTWDKSIKREDGNFMNLVDFLSKYNTELKDHLDTSPKNARYLSPKIQDQFITINGDLIRKSIVNDCNASLFWSLMADESVDISTTEQVSVCIRYLSENRTGMLSVNEEFVGFCSFPSIDAETITNAIIEDTDSCGLKMENMVGKGFDGASNMCGHVSGVSTRLQRLYPNAKYLTHCRNHALSLVIVASCKSVPDVRNFMDSLKELTLFFKYSAKRKHILRRHLKSSKEYGDFLDDLDEDDPIVKRKYQGLPVLSDTRWLTRSDSIDCLLQNYRAVCESVEAVGDVSYGQSASDSDSFLKRLLSFEFLVSAIICRHVLAYTGPLTIALQAKDCDLYKAHKMAQRLVEALVNERTTEKFCNLWQRITRISSDLEIEPVKKRTVRKQSYRSNPPIEDIEAYYRITFYYAFLDHAISHLKTRFSQELEGALFATYLLPGNISNLSDEIIDQIRVEFAVYLPHQSSLGHEISSV